MSENLQAGKLVREFRIKQNMPVWMLALLSGVKPKDVVGLEEGCPGLQNGYFLERVAIALGVSVESIQPDYSNSADHCT